MLAKALAAKDAALENAVDKARLRSERVDQLTKRFEQERAVLETAHRRLLEELENERAERTLAQGALKIARESRASLQRLNESLKRQNRSIRTAADAEIVADDRPDTGVEDSTNVSKFVPPPRDRHGPDLS
jgi:crescentin